MANPEHVALVKKGAEAIEARRRQNHTVWLDLAGADFFTAELSGVFLSRANLSGASLDWADLDEANLYEADLSGANLYSADLVGADLAGANLSEAKFNRTSVAMCDLSRCVGLQTVVHEAPSSISVDTLIESFRGAGNKLTPQLETFLRGAGVPRELLEALPGIVSEIKYRSCFVSYGEPDRGFAEKLAKDLKVREISCWLFSLDAKPGAGLVKEIEENIRRAEKMIVVCSKASLVSPGALKELKSQIRKDVDSIVPVSLDNVWAGDDFPVEWEGQNLRPFLTRQIYADFSGSVSYEEALERLLTGLRRADDR